MIQNTTAEKYKTISIERTFDLPLEKVWKAWSDPEYCKKWWGPEGYKCPSCTIDFTEGGKYLMSMKGPDGKEVWSTGTYKEIVPLKKIVYSDSFADAQGNIVPASYYNMPGDWDLKLMVSVEFEETNGKTRMTMQHAGLPIEMSDDCIQGWQSSFNKLENSLK